MSRRFVCSEDMVDFLARASDSCAPRASIASSSERRGLATLYSLDVDVRESSIDAVRRQLERVDAEERARIECEHLCSPVLGEDSAQIDTWIARVRAALRSRELGAALNMLEAREFAEVLEAGAESTRPFEVRAIELVKPGRLTLEIMAVRGTALGRRQRTTASASYRSARGLAIEYLFATVDT